MMPHTKLVEVPGLEETNWWIITGGPQAGKTELVKELERRGYNVVYETARDIIDEKLSEGLTIDKIRADER